MPPSRCRSTYRAGSSTEGIGHILRERHRRFLPCLRCSPRRSSLCRPTFPTTFLPFVDAAKMWLGTLAGKENFAVDYIEDTAKIDDAFLAKYALFLQLNYPPYMWTDTAKAAFIKYIEEGKGGWVGFHHATLLGEFDGFQIWPWFHQFMGGIRFKNYIPTFVTGEVTVEDKNHPVMRGIASPFVIKDEE